MSVLSGLPELPAAELRIEQHRTASWEPTTRVTNGQKTQISVEQVGDERKLNVVVVGW